MNFKVRKGDVEGAWSKCDVIVEREFYVPHVQHAPIEPHIAIAQAEKTGGVTLWTSSQSPFAQRHLIAESLDIPHRDVRVIGIIQELESRNQYEIRGA